MKVKHPFPKGKRYFCSSQKIVGRCYKPRLPFYWGLTIDGLWWNETLKKWGTFKEFKDTHTNYGTHMNTVKSVKAAMRHVRKHDEIPKGTKVTLCSNFVGCNVIITK